MADPKDKVPESVPGKYYVDTQCIDCDVCRVTAAQNFQRNEDKGYSYVSSQPVSPEEVHRDRSVRAQHRDRREPVEQPARMWSQRHGVAVGKVEAHARESVGGQVRREDPHEVIV